MPQAPRRELLMRWKFDQPLRNNSGRWVRTAAWLLAVGLLAMAVACGSSEEANNSNANRANTASNTMANTAANTMSNVATNSTANSNSIAHTGNVGSPVDTETLTDALRTQLSHDNPSEMPPDHAPVNWLDSNIGSYYKYDDEITKLTVCKVTENTLKKAGMKMASFAKEKLYRKVTAHSSCRQALSEMAKATLSSTPINPVP